MSIENQIPVTPAAANVVANPTEFSYADSVNRLLADDKALGHQIFGSFVGELVAQGGVTSLNGSHETPVQVLEHIVTATKDTTKQTIPWEKGVSTFTRTDGLRLAANAMAGDSRTGQLFNTASRELAVNEAGEIAFTNASQLEAYLTTLNRKNGSGEEVSWNDLIGPIFNHAFKNEHEFGQRPLSPFDDKNSRYSHLQFERDKQLKFDAALQKAIAVGADVALLERSGRTIRDQYQQRRTLGSIALT